ncbi:hemerythrin domain-containing protein [Frankia sp. AiPs1]|uniref:hemerythrin domain-containing protein n=1 Tax=Frankia sp. AiPs1 TaxID=573493 RepID=UPI002043B65E|nr:hemerythrin domain-containing protein [Frankia sp. AiPs1]MCM3924099.1 hemerythrin domain-containing protein [Frankia sp. AiPs1]
MTISAAPDTEMERPNTQEMAIIHRAFRRESRLLAELTARVPAGDTARARVLAGYFRWYQSGLGVHHHGEDELVWPLLLARLDLGADVVLRMEAQHEKVAASLARAQTALVAWEAGADRSDRDALVEALVEHRAVLTEHLDDEETHLLPLAAAYLSVPEWAAQGEHFLANTPKNALVTLLGAVLEDVQPAERKAFLAGLPRPARIIWFTVGRILYAAHVRRIRGGHRPAAIAADQPGAVDEASAVDEAAPATRLAR